jgi:hypothetical protein
MPSSNRRRGVGDRAEDRGGRLGPDEGTKVLVPSGQPLLDSGPQLGNSAMRGAAQPLRSSARRTSIPRDSARMPSSTLSAVWGRLLQPMARFHVQRFALSRFRFPSTGSGIQHHSRLVLTLTLALAFAAFGPWTFPGGRSPERPVIQEAVDSTTWQDPRHRSAVPDDPLGVGRATPRERSRRKRPSFWTRL